MASEHRPYLAYLSKNGDAGTALAARDAVAQMFAMQGWTLVQELIEEVHGQAVTRLLLSHAGSDGHVYEQAEYARLLGFLSGLRQARWAAEAFIEHAERVRKKES